MELSIIIPANNEAEGIREVLEDIKQTMETSSLKHEIIVVDDGSTDGTDEIAGKMQGIKVILHTENKGYGAALKTGIRNAEAEWILIIDGDGTYDPKEIPKLLKHVD